MSTTNAGGWGPWSFEPTAADREVLQEALTGLKGATYQALAVQQQVVSGTNYHFICEGTMVVPSQPKFVAMITVYKPLDGKAVLQQINQVGPSPTGLYGGFSSWRFPLKDTDIAVFKAATAGLDGMDYTPLATTSQVINGLRYVFLAKGVVVYPGANPNPYLVTIIETHTDPAHPHIESIQEIKA